MLLIEKIVIFPQLLMLCILKKDNEIRGKDLSKSVSHLVIKSHH